MWRRQNSEIVCKNYDVKKSVLIYYYYYYYLHHHYHYVTYILTQLGYGR